MAEVYDHYSIKDLLQTCFFETVLYPSKHPTLLFLLGCAHTYKDSPNLGFSLPEQWQASSVVKLDPNNDRWIHYFKDNEQLRGLIEKGLASNYNLSIANSRVLIAQAELKAISPNQLPEIKLQMRGARQKYNTTSAFSPPGLLMIIH